MASDVIYSNHHGSLLIKTMEYMLGEGDQKFGIFVNSWRANQYES
jgi:hypothetical protein